MDRVFKAIADPSQRRLLDALRVHDGLSLGELRDELPQMTRFGVAARLDVLIGANLVTAIEQADASCTTSTRCH